MGFTLPAAADTVEAKVACCYRTLQRLLEEHNGQGALVRSGHLDLKTFRVWQKAWEGREASVWAELHKLRSSVPSYDEADPRYRQESDGRYAEQMSGRADTAWDTVDLGKITPASAPVAGIDPVENFGTWVETDPNNKLSQAGAVASFANMTRSDNCWCARTGLNLNGDWEHTYSNILTASSTTPVWGPKFVWETAPAVITTGYIDQDGAGYLRQRQYEQFVIVYTNGVRPYLQMPNLPAGEYLHRFWIKDKLDTAVGAHGTYYVYVYKDAARTILHCSGSVARQATVTYAAANVTVSSPSGTEWGTGDVSDLDMGLVIPGPRFWVGGGGNDLWSNADNWSDVTGGAGGAGVPEPGYPVTFDAGGGADCDLDVLAITVSELNITAGYAGTLTGAAANGTLTVTGAFTQAGGTVLCGTHSVSAGSLSLSAGILDLGGQNLTVTGALTLGASAVLRLDGTETITRGSLSLSPTAVVMYYDNLQTALLNRFGTAFPILDLDASGGKTVTTTAGTTLAIGAVLASGASAGSPVVIASAVPGTAYRWDVSGGSLLADRATISDLDASGGGEVRAYGSTNGGGNTNVAFSAPLPASGGVTQVFYDAVGNPCDRATYMGLVEDPAHAVGYQRYTLGGDEIEVFARYSGIRHGECASCPATYESTISGNPANPAHDGLHGEQCVEASGGCCLVGFSACCYAVEQAGGVEV